MNECPIHRQPLKLVPAGVSKSTGKPYNSFYACPERGCQYRPPRDGQPTGTGYTPPRGMAFDRVPGSRPATDWDSVGKQKALCGMVNGMLSAGKTPVEVSNSMVELNGIFQKIQTLSGVPVTKAAPMTGTAAQSQGFAPRVITPEEPPLDSFEADLQAGVV